MSSKKQSELIIDAMIFAASKHKGQVRKDQHASPYITHPVAVAKAITEIGRVSDIPTLISAILHDTLEDTDTDEEEIKRIFGEEILEIVREVTDDKSLEKMERKRRQVVHAADLSQAAKLIKLGDKLVNCQDILQSPPEDWTPERRKNYIQWAADVVSEIRGTNAPLEAAFDQMLEKAEEHLDFKVKPFTTVDQRPWAPHPNNPQE